jgi:hypothetical protein
LPSTNLKVIRQFALTETAQKPFSLPLMGMQAETCAIHVTNCRCCLQIGQDDPYPLNRVRGKPPPIVVLKELAQSFMPEALDHLE